MEAVLRAKRGGARRGVTQPLSEKKLLRLRLPILGG